MGVHAKFQQFKLRTDTDSVQGAEHRRAIPRSELTEAELQCHQRVLLTNDMFDFPEFCLCGVQRGEGHGHGGEIVEAIEAFDPDGKCSHQCR